ncbi:MAG: glucose-6-phosphate isomerase [Microbacterium sp. 71-36]|uniref:glucose-6-phosphate isomerase n=1 Tax=unclassified Microbacterium TaxID=2609290 RepID=UPI00086EE29D|nr:MULTISPECIES: glucose-6-phosphate isomerase [unclassified Microbacterium]MBN9212707.1 glucose-6-phosphate isomerase [Microbacterium sp.]ODT39285.1 MAG: glucose-6-phosphate isomerase [Microbacterium sp. SCN 71-17]ODU51374.1 MAG: glucose-6-phosphate isomerase [Microbacterium sp. SCN 70-10]OJV76812.1 MAG: glucose-6-phosphate isomerase [Microbacterium sp. 71-36]
MTFAVKVTGHVESVVHAELPALVDSLVASGITAGDSSLWGPAVEDEASRRLGWVQAVSVSRPLVPEITALRDEFVAQGVTRVVLAGMGGSSLAPEVIARSAGVPLVILDSTAPGQVLAAIDGDAEAGGLRETVLVVSSKSGSTIETDSARRAFEAAYRDLGIDPAERIVVVTDPGSPLDQAARADGYRVFTADPTVGGRYSALTAFGLVPAGLAGVDIDDLLDEADATLLEVAIDSPENPALVLAAAIAGGGASRRDKLGLVTDGSHLPGLPDWIEQLVAESTGKDGTGILPVVLLPVSPELESKPADLQVVRFVDHADAFHLFDRHEGEILVSGSLGAQFVVWEYATAIAGRLLGIDPFDQPDVEAAKVAARGLLEERPEPAPPALVLDGVEVRVSDPALASGGTLASVLDALWALVPADGYVSVQAYVNRLDVPQLAGLRELVAADSGRPTTFGWGPRFLHSTGQYHKGGPATGVFLQITERTDVDLEIPGRPFTFGQLINAQAAGDASVLAEGHGRPVVTLTLTDPQVEVLSLFEAAQ